MEYWRGYMNWPLSKDWKCETCNTRSALIWGMPHAVCRCLTCHTEYCMRDKEDKVVDVPISLLKDEYKEPAKLGFEKYHKPLSEFTDEEWDAVIKQKAA